MENKSPTVFIEKALSSINIKPAIIMKSSDLTQNTKELISKKFDLNFVENRNSHVSITVSNSKPGSHKLDAVTLFAVALLINKTNSKSISAITLENDLLEAAKTSDNNTRTSDDSLFKNLKSGVIVSDAIRVLLSSCGLPVEEKGQDLLTELEQKNCLKFLNQFTQTKVKVA